MGITALIVIWPPREKTSSGFYHAMGIRPGHTNNAPLLAVRFIPKSPLIHKEKSSKKERVIVIIINVGNRSMQI